MKKERYVRGNHKLKVEITIKAKSEEEAKELLKKICRGKYMLVKMLN